MESNAGPQTRKRLFYGFIIVAVIFVIHLISYGINDSFGVFVDPWANEFGWTRAAISGAYSLAFFITGVMGIVMGVITDKYGPRLALSICAVFLGTALLLISKMTAQWQLFLFYGLIFGIGMSGIWVPLLSVISRWFILKRGLITGIAISGGGIGAFIGPPVITWLITSYDWTKAAWILGIFVLVAVFVAAQFLRRDPGKTGQQPYGGNNTQSEIPITSNRDFSLKEALHTPQFWTIFAMFFCLSFYTFSILVHYVPHAIQTGVSSENAALVLACISGVSIAGNFIMGYAGDKIGPRKIFIVSFVLMSAALFWLTQAKEIWALYVFSVVFGFNHGGNATAQAPLMARIFGLKAHGKIFAVAAFGFTLGGAVGPLVSGYIYDVTGGYVPAFILCGAIGIIGLVLAAILRPTGRISAAI